MDALAAGHDAALNDLMGRHATPVFHFLCRMLGNEDDANDVVQEAYLRAFSGLPRFRGEARFSTWLYRVTANCASNHLARASRSRHDELDPDGIDQRALRDRRPEHDPEARASAGDERAKLAAALLRLPWRLRQVVVLRDVYDLSHKAIAAELGISEAAAKVRLQRARLRLREDLGGGRVEGTRVARRLVEVRDDDAVAS